MSRKITPTLHESGCYQIGPTHTSFGRSVILVNPDERNWTDNRFVLHFGAYGWTCLMVWARHLEDALDEAIDWIAEHAPGLLCDDEVQEEYERLIAEGKSEEKAMEEAEQDTTIGGNAGNRILSYEWGISLENPTRQELDEFLFPPGCGWEKERDAGKI